MATSLNVPSSLDAGNKTPENCPPCDTAVVPWHPITQPECTNCHGLARPVRPYKPVHDCGRAQIQIDYKTRIRARLRRFIRDAELPQAEVAALLGMNPVTLWRILKGGPITDVVVSQVMALEYIKREHTVVTVIYRVATRTHWDSMIHKRQRKALGLSDPLADDVAALASHLAQQRHGSGTVIATPRRKRRRTLVS